MLLSVRSAVFNRRLVDGWINERRKGTDDGGLLFASRTKDYRPAAFVRQITAVAVLLPALCSTNIRVRTVAATWLAANAARSSIASSALMEEVDEARVETELNLCPCCYCRGGSDRKKGQAPNSMGPLVFSGKTHLQCSSNSFQCKASSPIPEKQLMTVMGDGLEGNAESPSCQQLPGPGAPETPSLSCSLRPLAAKDLLLAESPVMDSTAEQAAALSPAESQTSKEPDSGFRENAALVGNLSSPKGTQSADSCSEETCHRGRCSSSISASVVPDVSEAWSAVSKDSNQAEVLWNTLYSLIKVPLLLHPDTVLEFVELRVCIGLCWVQRGQERRAVLYSGCVSSSGW